MRCINRISNISAAAQTRGYVIMSPEIRDGARLADHGNRLFSVYRLRDRCNSTAAAAAAAPPSTFV